MSQKKKSKFDLLVKRVVKEVKRQLIPSIRKMIRENVKEEVKYSVELLSETGVFQIQNTPNHRNTSINNKHINEEVTKKKSSGNYKPGTIEEQYHSLMSQDPDMNFNNVYDDTETNSNNSDTNDNWTQPTINVGGVDIPVGDDRPKPKPGGVTLEGIDKSAYSLPDEVKHQLINIQTKDYSEIMKRTK